MDDSDMPTPVLDAQVPPPSTSPDIMNDAAYDPPPPPPKRRDTISTDGGRSDRFQDTCRICRSEGTPSEPLFHPCKCSGSIKFVHQECLMEWLSHSNKKHCELCKTPFHFTKLYDSSMPSVLPLDVFLTRASLHVSWGVARWCRILLVGSVWLAVLPWIIRWCWRWMFWFADAGWAKELFLYKLHAGEMLPNGFTPAQQTQSSMQEAMSWIKETAGLNGSLNRTWDVIGHGFKAMQMSANNIDGAVNITIDLEDTAKAARNGTFSFLYTTRPATSLFSEWSYIANLTTSPRLNSTIVDVFEGQLITAIVIIGFILVFLIREWVVQQQPLINLENAALDRLNAEHDRLLRQRDLLNAARERVHDFRQGLPGGDVAELATGDEDHYQGWETLEATINRANIYLFSDDLSKQILFAGSIKTIKGVASPPAELAEKLSKKIAVFEDRNRGIWQASLVIGLDHVSQDVNKRQEGSLEASGSTRGSSDATTEGPFEISEETNENNASAAEGRQDAANDENAPQRPQLDRQLTSKAADIQRILQEAGDSSQEDLANLDIERQPKSSSPRSNEGASSDFSGTSWEEVAPQTPQQQEENRDGFQMALFAARMHGRELFSNSHEWMEEPDTLAAPLPIINVGSDTRIKLKIRRNDDDVEKAQQVPLLLRVPEPKDGNGVEIDEVILQRLEQIPMATNTPPSPVVTPGETASDHSPEASGEADQLPSSEPSALAQLEAELAEEENSVPARISDYLMEDLGIDEAERVENLRQAGLGPNVDEPNAGEGRAAARGTQPLRPVPARQAPGVRGPLTWVFEWFWGDLVQNTAGQATGNPNREARLGAEETTEHTELGHEQAHDPAGQPDPEHQDRAEQEDNDPAAIPEAIPDVEAAEDGPEIPDAEALEDAEDLEGIFELIGSGAARVSGSSIHS